MNDDDLRARLHELSPTPQEIDPVAVDPVAISGTARRRRRRRVVGVGAAVVIVAAAVAVPLAMSGPSKSAPVSVAASGSTGTTQEASIGDCTLSQLRIRPGHVEHEGLGRGAVTLTIVMTNVDKHSCQLTAYPNFAGVTQAGTRTDLLRSGMYQAPLVLRPGASGEVLVDGGSHLPQNTQSPCPLYSTFVIQLAGQTATLSLSRVAASIGSCLPAEVSPFGVSGSFGGLDGVSQPLKSTSMPYCDQSNFRLGVPPSVPVVTPNGPGRVQVNLNVTNTGPPCETIPFINLNLYGSHDVLLAGQQTEVFDGSDPVAHNFVLPTARTANFGLVLPTSVSAGTCTPLSAIELAGSTGRVELNAQAGGLQFCGTIMQAPVALPAYEAPVPAA